MFKMYDYQQSSFDAFFKYIKKKKGNPLIVAPMAAGKSVIIANIIDKYVELYENNRVLMLVHTKELIKQNAECYHEWFPDRAYGICASSLKRKETNNKVIFGQIQTVGGKAMINEFKNIDLLIVDEAHWGMAAKGTMYNKLIQKLKKDNPNLVVLGLTATAFTMSGGCLLNGNVFDDIAYEIPMTILIERGFLCEPIARPGEYQPDLSKIKKTGGDYNISQMAQAFHEDDITVKALEEVLVYGKNRKKWIIFCVNVAHIHEVNDYLNSIGIKSAAVTGDMNQSQRDQVVADYTKGKYRAIVNCGILTTGFNVKDIDLVVMLRATKSAGLWLQIVGRGMRIHPDKNDCLVLDFGKNISEFGAIDKLKISAKKKKGKDEIIKTPVKLCPNKLCKAVNPVSTRICKFCNTEFPKSDGIINIETVSDNGAILSTQTVKPTIINLDSIVYTRHTKISTKSVSMKVIYRKGMNMYTEFLAIGNPRAAFKVNKWWKLRCDLPVPETVDEAIRLAKSGVLREPKSIYMRKVGKYDTITAYDFGNDDIIKA